MHELSLALSLIDCIEESAVAPASIRAVHLRVGDRSGVSRDALAFAFETACYGSPLAGARLLCQSAGGAELEVVGLEVVDAPENSNANANAHANT